MLDPTPEQRAADPMRTAIWYNPTLFGPNVGKWNARSLHAAEMPGANAIGAARSIARFYAVVAAGGGPLFAPESLALATQTLAFDLDILNGERRHYGAGFSLQVSEKDAVRPPP